MKCFSVLPCGGLGVSDSNSFRFYDSFESKLTVQILFQVWYLWNDMFIQVDADTIWNETHSANAARMVRTYFVIVFYRTINWWEQWLWLDCIIGSLSCRENRSNDELTSWPAIPTFWTWFMEGDGWETYCCLFYGSFWELRERSVFFCHCFNQQSNGLTNRMNSFF